MSHQGVGTLVIGASQAGFQLASSLRKYGAEGGITLVGSETRPPYQRPALSKGFLQGTLPEERLWLRGAAYYEEQHIELVSGERIATINLSDRVAGSGEAVAESGRRFTFDRLALTVGGLPRRMTVPGSELHGIHYLRKIDDAIGLRADLDAADHVVVVGGGYVGLEAAAAATAAGKHVTVVEALDRLLARTVAPVMSDFYKAAHRRRGTEILLGATVTAFLGSDHVEQVELADGRRLPAGAVVVGIGLVPLTRLAEQIGLTCEGGIVVDEAARTSIPSIVAAGDCTVIAQPDRGTLRLESVQNAIAQAKTAAATLLGLDPPETGVPWFWSDQADLKLQTAGLHAEYDEVVLRGDPATEQFSALYYLDGRLLSIDAVNSPRDYMAVRKLLDSGRSIPPQAAADTSIPLKDFVRATR